MDEAQQLALVERLAKFKSEGDVESALNLYHPSVELAWPSLASVARGSAAVREALRRFFAVLPDYRVRVTSWHREGGVLHATAEVSATPQVEGQPARTALLAARLAFEFEDHCIKREVFDLDHAALATQSGLNPSQLLRALGGGQAREVGQRNAPLKLYTWSTQNARKISVMLEECGLDYEIEPVNILQDEQFSGEFTQLNPNQKIPVLIDPTLTDAAGLPVPIFETGAILLHLAERSGRFLPFNPGERIKAISWLFWQCSGVGPSLGNFAHFASALAPDRSQLNAFLAHTGASEVQPYPIQRFSKESYRLLGVMERQLSQHPYLAGELSIADFATYPWVESAWSGLQAMNPTFISSLRHTQAWMSRLAARPALQRGMARLAWGVDLRAEHAVPS